MLLQPGLFIEPTAMIIQFFKVKIWRPQNVNNLSVKTI